MQAPTHSNRNDQIAQYSGFAIEPTICGGNIFNRARTRWTQNPTAEGYKDYGFHWLAAHTWPI
jgi:hypothetical protein